MADESVVMEADSPTREELGAGHDADDKPPPPPADGKENVAMSSQPSEKPAPPPRKRPKLDLSGALGGGKRAGKSAFGLMLGTLNKAKMEDKLRNATDAAKKRQLIDQRLQAKIAKDTETVRRVEETKKDKQAANRKEEELALRDAMHASRHKRLLHLSGLLSTADDIRALDEDEEDEPAMDDADDMHHRGEDIDADAEGRKDRGRTKKPKPDPLRLPPRAHPPHIYYLPAILLPSQKTYIDKRKAEVSDALEKENAIWTTERKGLVEEIVSLRDKATEGERRLREEREAAGKVDKEPDTARDGEGEGDEDDVQMEIEEDDETGEGKVDRFGRRGRGRDRDRDREREGEREKEREKQREREREREREEEHAVAAAISKAHSMDEDDAVEY